MPKIDPNSPAFPGTTNGADGNFVNAPQWGMTLRQWYAGQALAGLCAAPTIAAAPLSEVAEDAVEIADMLIEALDSDAE